MKVLALPLNASHVQEGQLSALRAIADVHVIDYMAMGPPPAANQSFVEAALQVKPAWVWMQLQETGVIDPDAILRLRQELPGTVFMHWMGDAREHVPKGLANICKATHLTLVSSRGQLDMYRAAGATRAEYLQIGLDWREDVLGEREADLRFHVPDVVFCGNFYGDAFRRGTEARLGAIRALVRAKIDVGVVGTGWPRGIPVVGECHVKEQHHVYRRAKVALSVSHFAALESYYSDRQLIAMASGTPVVCQYVPGLGREFVHGEHCLWYATEDQLVRNVEELLGDAGRRERLGRAGRAEVVRNHTWFSRFLGLLPLVEEIRAGLTPT